MRTLQIGMSWYPEQSGNGLDRVYHALTRYLPQTGVDVEGLVVGSDNVAESTENSIRAFASIEAPLMKRLVALRRTLRGDVDPKRFDLVAVHFALYAFPALDLIRHRPLLIHFHGPWALESHTEGENPWKVRAKAAIEHAVYRRGNRFIVLSKAFCQVLRDHYNVPEERIQIIPGGVDVDRFDTRITKREARHQLGWPQDRPIVLSVRRLVRRVGLENLIEAMRAVRERIPEALLLIAGKGPLADELDARIHAADLDRSVRLLGFVTEEDLPLAYRASDVSVVPTTALEGFGLVAVESLAAGTPVLVAPVGGLPEVVHDLSEDLILPDATPSTLAEYLIDALGGTNRLPDSDLCRDYARTHFDWPVVAARINSVYGDLLS